MNENNIKYINYNWFCFQHSKLLLIFTTSTSSNLQLFSICVASLQKGPHVAKIKKNEIFVDLNRTGHHKSVENFFNVLAQIFTKLWSI